MLLVTNINSGGLKHIVTVTVRVGACVGSREVNGKKEETINVFYFNIILLS